jgi:hypothetical protein
MRDFPPEGSSRKKVAIRVWIALTILFAAVLAFGVYRWVTQQVEFPVLAAIGGIGGFIAVWRWIVETTRAPSN